MLNIVISSNIRWNEEDWGHLPRRAGIPRSLLSETTRKGGDDRIYVRDAIYDVGYDYEYDYSGFPTIPPEDDVVLATVLPGGVTSLQELCPKPALFSLSEHCNCSTSASKCLKLNNKTFVQEVSPFAPPGTVVTPYIDGQGCSPPDELVGCLCEWENTCSFVEFAELYMDIVCASCDGISPGRDAIRNSSRPPAPEPAPAPSSSVVLRV